MYYRDIALMSLFDCKRVQRFITRKSPHNIFCEIEFSDKDYSAFYDCFLDSKSVQFSVTGDDGMVYYLQKDGPVKTNRNGTYNPDVWKRYLTYEKKRYSDLCFWNEFLSKTDKNKNFFIKKTTTGFDKYVFADKESARSVPYRFKKAEGGNRPLLIWFTGACSLGHNNLKPYLEFQQIYRYVKKYDCNIIIPQAGRGDNGFEHRGLEYFVASVFKIVKILLEEGQIDEKHIYVGGVSFGGGCVWQALADYPEMICSALSVMGNLPYNVKYTKKEIFERIKDIPIWIAHSSNDHIVSITSDDYCYEELKKINGNIKYTRWDKYGHSMCYIFFRKEKWADFLFLD